MKMMLDSYRELYDSYLRPRAGSTVPQVDPLAA